MDEQPMSEAAEEQALVAAKPVWLQDGKGVQGDRRVFYSDRAAGMPEAMRQSQDNPQPPTSTSQSNAEGPERIPSANSPETALSTLSNVIIVFNGTAYYCDLTGKIDGPV